MRLKKRIILFFLVVPFLLPFNALAQTENDLINLYPKYTELLKVSKYREAIPVALRILEITEKLYGPEHPYTAASLNGLGILYYNINDYAKAEPILTRALQITEKSLGKDHTDVALVLVVLANLYNSKGNYAESKFLNERALGIYEKTLGNDHPSSANCLNNLALLSEEMGDYVKAKLLYMQALEIREKVLGLEHPDTAISLNNLAGLYKAINDYGNAELLYNQALQISVKSLGPEHPTTATYLNNLAGLYEVKKDYARAESLYNQALQISIKALGSNHPDTVNCQNNLALLYRTMARYAEAELLFKNVLKIREKMVGPGHPDTAASLNNLASLYQDMGNYSAAEPLFKKALKIREKVFGQEHTDTATSLNDLALLYKIKNDYGKAEALFKQAVQIDEKILGQEHPNTATSLSNLACLYQDIGDYAKAESLNKRALKIEEKAFGLEHISTVICLNNLAVIYQYMGNYTEAETLLEQALQIAEKIFGSEHPDTATSLNNLAFLYQTIGDYAKAEQQYKRAIEIQKKTLGSEHPSTTITLNNLACMYIEQGQLSQAEIILKKTNNAARWGYYYLTANDFKKAETSFSSLNVNTMEGKIAKLIGLGLAHEGQSNFIAAKEAFMKAISLTEKHYATLTFSQRQTYFTGKILTFPRIEPYEGMVRILLKEKRTGCEAQALWYAERAKSRILQEMLAARELGGATVEDKLIFEKDREFQKQLIVLNKRIEVMADMGKKAPRGEVQKLGAELEAAHAKYEDFLKDVKFKNAELASLIGTLPPTVHEVQAHLDDDVTVLAYYTGKDKTLAWLVTKSSVKVFELNSADKELNAKAISNKVDGWLAMNVSTRSRRPTPIITLPMDNSSAIETAPAQRELNRQEFNRLSHELYSQLLAPVAGEIKTHKLVIVPHGILNRIPFASLTDGSKALVERFDLSVAPSVSAIEFIVKKRKASSGRLTAFANPANDKMLLPYTEAEVREIQPLFKQADIYSRADATETAAKQHTSTSDVVHFACHGEFNDHQPLQSGLLLAADADNDGILQMHEIYGMNLRQANLVTLSACETALCKIQGGEDWAGMSRGFIYAGTPSILATLWSVDDKSTAILMKNFYTNWLQKGMTKPAALRQAQLDLKAIPEYSHPFYWAPFVMIGDWR